MSALLGPDGKEMAQPVARKMPTRREKFNMVMMMFTLMNREERQMLLKQLRPLRRKLDLMYPMGMTETDIKNDLEKAAQSMIEEAENEPEPMTDEERALENEINEAANESVPDEPADAVAENPQVGAEQSVSVQPTSDANSAEIAPTGEEGGC